MKTLEQCKDYFIKRFSKRNIKIVSLGKRSESYDWSFSIQNDWDPEATTYDLRLDFPEEIVETSRGIPVMGVSAAVKCPGIPEMKIVKGSHDQVLQSLCLFISRHYDSLEGAAHFINSLSGNVPFRFTVSNDQYNLQMNGKSQELEFHSASQEFLSNEVPGFGGDMLSIEPLVAGAVNLTDQMVLEMVGKK